MKLSKLTIVCLISATVALSCKKNETPTEKPAISAEVLAKIEKMGFSTDGVVQQKGGYLVEGDIFISNNDLGVETNSPTLRVANSEQYRTTNLVTGLPRTITVSVTNLPAVYAQATDSMISRYNNLNLRIHFTRVSSGGNVDIVGFNQPPSGGFITLGSSGFPTSSGSPYNQIKMNTNEAAYGSNPNLLYVASVLQHEMGHCIGFRHTDYMDRSYSCGGRKVNEEKPSSGLGAILIPGTPTGPDANSFMLACSNGGNRTFNPNDVIAVNYLYH